MPRWIERRGVTLQAPGEPDRYVRLSMMERVGLVLGGWNVREARAEPEPGGGSRAMRIVGPGRPLSWRWLREPEAAQLLDERLHALEIMGYVRLEDRGASPGRWDWFLELVQRRLHPSQDDANARSDSAADRLRRALSGPLEALLVDLAAVLELREDELARPEPERARGIDPEQLAILLPFLVHHDRAELRTIGERWLACDPVPYQVPRHRLLQWLETDARIATLLAPRIRREGLALIGPQALVRLGRSSQIAVRGPARAWSLRLGT